jgi:N-acetylmuramoyl-L-alanine amidase
MLINHNFKSKNSLDRQEDVIQFLVLHYTQVPVSTTLGIFTNNPELTKPDADFFAGLTTDPVALCNNKVSAHYVISEEGITYQLVDEELVAFHAGVSYWSGIQNINNNSIGIELENVGYDWAHEVVSARAVKINGSEKTWCQFAETQIEQTIALCHKIIEKYNIKPYNIVGHSDIACSRKYDPAPFSRKYDPGPLFPWQLLAKLGIGIWYDVSESTITANNLPEDRVEWMLNKLSEFGYDCSPLAEQDDRRMLHTIIQSFQMHFRPNNIDGDIDLECMQIIDSLCKRKHAYDLQDSEIKASAQSNSTSYIR